jgi:hypothetical protein
VNHHRLLTSKDRGKQERGEGAPILLFKMGKEGGFCKLQTRKMGGNPGQKSQVYYTNINGIELGM